MVQSPFGILHFPRLLKSSISSLRISAALKVERCNLTPCVYMGKPRGFSVRGNKKLAGYWDTRSPPSRPPAVPSAGARPEGCPRLPAPPPGPPRAPGLPAGRAAAAAAAGTLVPRSRFPRRPGRLCGRTRPRRPAAARRRGGAGPGRAAPCRACAPAAPGRAGASAGSPSSEHRQSAAPGRQVNTPFGLRSVRGLQGLRGSPAPPGRAAGPGRASRCLRRAARPPSAYAGCVRGPGRGRVCIYSTKTSVVMCPSGRTRSRVHRKALCFSFPPPVAAPHLGRNLGCSPSVESSSPVCVGTACRHRALF